MIDPFRLRCSVVLADVHVCEAAMDLGLLAMDLSPAATSVKRRAISSPRGQRPICVVLAFEDGRSGTQLQVRSQGASARRAARVQGLVRRIAERAADAGHLPRRIGFRT
jgi:hypothetical protein